MPRRTDSQRIGSLGHKLAMAAFETSGQWIARSQDEDFGVDLELEYANPDPSGLFIKVQIKSSGGSHPGSEPIAIPLESAFLRYAHQCRVPFVVVQVATESGRTWWCWLQACVETHQLSSALYHGEQKTLTIRSEWFVFYDANSNEILQQIASGAHPISIALMIRDLMRASIGKRDYDLIKKSLDLIRSYQEHIPYLPLDLIIDEAINLDYRLWATEQGNILSGLIFDLCRLYGNSLTVEQIVRLVVRGDTYSRTGINALGIIYDQFPHYAESLRLTELFDDIKYDPRILYYCRLREKYIGRSGMEIAFGPLSIDVDEFTIIADSKDYLIAKWPNRGDSAFQDCIASVPDRFIAT